MHTRWTTHTPPLSRIPRYIYYVICNVFIEESLTLNNALGTWLLDELTIYDVTPCWKQVILFNT